MSLLKAATLMIIHTLMIMWNLIRFVAKSGASLKVILRIMRKKGCFKTVPEPTSQQLSNKIANMKKVKKVLNLSETLENT